MRSARGLRGLLVGALAALGTTLAGQAPVIPGAPTGQAPAVDLSGYWTPALHEDLMERGPGAELADYGGFPLNEAGRLWALSYDPSRVTLRHHQCEAYVTPYQMRALGNFRIWEERDPYTQRLVAIHLWAQTTEGHRVIWMDGRPHPPAWASHTFRGFSTGRFVGNALAVTTTHMKNGALRRGNGVPQSDQATLTEFFVRHGDHLTNITVVSDPVYLTEPMVRSSDFARQPVDPGAWLYACDDGEQILDRADDFVPHYLFGKQPFVREFSTRYKIPLAAGLLGAVTMYPELDTRVASATEAEGQAPCSPRRRTDCGNQQSHRSRAARRRRSTCFQSVTTSTCLWGRRQHRGADRRSGAFVVDTGEEARRQSHRRHPQPDEQTDPVHRQHQLQERAHGRERTSGRRRPGPELARVVLRAGGAPRRDRLLQRSGCARHDDGARQRAGAHAGRQRPCRFSACRHLPRGPAT